MNYTSGEDADKSVFLKQNNDSSLTTNPDVSFPAIHEVAFADIIVNPRLELPIVHILTEPILSTSAEINPNNTSKSISNSSAGYTRMYLSEAVTYPCVVLSIFFSLLLLFVILRLLRPVLKLYFSVILYTGANLYFTIIYLVNFIQVTIATLTTGYCDVTSIAAKYSFLVNAVV